jgi:hypothetical protein
MSMAGNFHVNDVGIGITVQILDQNNTPVDISGATDIVFDFTRPDGSTFDTDGSLVSGGVDGLVQYTTQDGDLNIIGTWVLQVTVFVGGAIYHSDTNVFKVLPNVFTWHVDMVTMLRYMVSDTGNPFVYSDASLQELILVAGRLTQMDIQFSQNYQVNIAQMSLSPDPSLEPRDEDFISFTTMKAACIIDNAEARLAAKRAVIMRDASKSVDLTEISRAKIELWKNGWCKTYKDSRFAYLMGDVTAGVAVLGPFRLEMNWMPGPWTPDGGGTGGYYAGGGYFGNDTLSDGRYR